MPRTRLAHTVLICGSAFALSACRHGGAAGDPGQPDEVAPRAPEDAAAEPPAPMPAPAVPGDASAASDARAPIRIQRDVAPRATDPRIDGWLEDHLVGVDPRVPPIGRLVVHLAGAGNLPVGDKELLRLLGGLGFHAVSLRYVHDYKIVDLCAKDPDPDCHGKLRLEAIEGRDHSPHVAVPAPSGLESRLGRLLGHLERQHPGEEWGRYLDGDGPRWGEIVISGHSHGASTAARLAKARPVARVVMLSGPFDNVSGAPAAWTHEASATPADRWYGLTHKHENQHAQHLVDWKALGLAPVEVEAGAVPVAGQAFVTNVTPPGTSSPHIATVPGAWSPKGADGRYLLEGVWRRLYGR